MRDFISRYFDSLKLSLESVEVTDNDGRMLGRDEAIERSVHLVMRRAEGGGRVYLVGNGGSAAIASHQAVDLWKNASIPAMAFNDASLLTSISNDYGYAHVFEKPLEVFLKDQDVLIAISSSGASENILRAVETAKEKGAAAISFSGFSEHNPLRRSSQINFYVPSGEYGFVEITHLTLLHAIVDTIIQSHRATQLAAKRAS